MINSQLRFIILVSIVGISGFSQGMLMPLIAIIFEGDGVHSSINGLHATSLYIGILLASPLMEAPLRRFGYKPLLLVGVASVAVALALFPVWKSFWFWFLLRLCIGIGDHMLHFATQTWITSISPAAKRGRNIAIYGLFFSLGFAFGPMLANTVKINEAFPFIISSIITVIAWLAILLLKNDFPESTMDKSSFLGSISRFKKVLKYAWVAMLPPLGFGFLEASLNGNFPVYALRNDLNVNAVAIILPAFSIGSIVSQMPLGMLSDTYGRNKVLKLVLFLGSIAFLVAGFIQSVTGMFICIGLAGMIVGSTYSLGISYMTDLLPKDLLPAGNLMCSIFFSVGSMIGPIIGGMTIHYFSGGSYFYLLSIMLIVVLICMFLFKKQPATAQSFNNSFN